MISYFGGKNKMSSWMYEFIPKDINKYVEVFSGAMWMYFNEDFSQCNEIVYNDINRHMVNLYECAKDPSFLPFIEKQITQGGKLWLDNSIMEATDYRQHFADIYYSTKKTDFLTDFDFPLGDKSKALKWLFMITSSFNGCHPSAAGFSGTSKTKKLKLNAFVNKLRKESFQDKFLPMTMENLDFEKIIQKYEDPNTFLYLDPPYADDLGPFSDKTNNRLNWYGVDNDKFGAASHHRLAELLHNSKSRWMLSYYDFPQLDEWFPKDKYRWEAKEFFRSSASFSDNKDKKGKEVLIMNY